MLEGQRALPEMCQALVTEKEIEMKKLSNALWVLCASAAVLIGGQMFGKARAADCDDKADCIVEHCFYQASPSACIEWVNGQAANDPYNATGGDNTHAGNCSGSNIWNVRTGCTIDCPGRAFSVAADCSHGSILSWGVGSNCECVDD